MPTLTSVQSPRQLLDGRLVTLSGMSEVVGPWAHQIYRNRRPISNATHQHAHIFRPFAISVPGYSIKMHTHFFRILYVIYLALVSYLLEIIKIT